MDNTDKKRLGNAIRTAREAAGLTQTQLAAKLNVEQRTVSNWERGITTPLSKLGALENALGVNLRDSNGRPLGRPDLPPRGPEDRGPAFVEWLHRRMYDIGIDSIRGLARQIDVAPETARQLLAGTRVPHEDTLKKMSRTLRLPHEDSATLLLDLRDMAGLPVGEVAPYVPPKRADQLNARERKLVDELIHVILDARENRASGEGV